VKIVGGCKDMEARRRAMPARISLLWFQRALCAVGVLCSAAAGWGCSRTVQGDGADATGERSCRDDGDVYDHGDTWVCSDGCGLCKCFDGRVTETETSFCASSVNGGRPVPTPPFPPQEDFPREDLPPLSCGIQERGFPNQRACLLEFANCRRINAMLWCGSEAQCCEAEAECPAGTITYATPAACVDAAGSSCDVVSVCCSTVYCGPVDTGTGGVDDEDGGVGGDGDGTVADDDAGT